MFAVVKTGGKQYRVAPGDILKVERLEGEAGDTVTLDQVLLVGDGDRTTAGTPLVDGTVVTAEILEQTRAKKVIVFKKKRRHNYRRKKGHRQHLTVLRVLEIGAPKKKTAKKAAGKDASEKKAPAKKAAGAAEDGAATKKAPAKKAAPKKTAAKKTTTAKKTAAAKKTDDEAK